MSVFSTLLTTALSVISTNKSEALSYATAAGQSFTSMTGFVIHQDRIAAPVYNENGRVIAQRMTGYVKGPVTPLMALGYQIKDSTPATPLTWAVEGVKIEQQQIITIWREERVGVNSPDRGANA